MYGINYIRQVLSKYINGQTDQFIIYPFGVNGVNVKNVLKDFFGLNPCFIVDNECSKYNPCIINKETLREVYQKEMYLILTIENNKINSEIRNELLEFIPMENIINLYTGKGIKDIGNYEGKGFLLKDFLPHVIANREVCVEGRGKKIKLRINYSSPLIWNIVSPIYLAFAADEMFDVLLIIDKWKREEMIRQVKGHGYQYIMCDEYQGDLDQPDILIFCASFDKMLEGMLACRNYAKLVIVPYWALLNYFSLDLFWERLQKDFGVYRPDYYLFDSLLYEEIKNSDYFSDKIVEMGNIKFDGIYSAVQSKRYDGGWKKLEGKRIILWATTHGINDGLIPVGMAFDLCAKPFWEYAERNPDMGFIVRMHPVLIDEMRKSGFWSQNDLNLLKEYCSNSSNIVFDDTDTYDNSLAIADGILTDSGCGIMCSALPTLKPICIAYRSIRDRAICEELGRSLYSAYDRKDIVNFFDMVKNRQDPMLELRREASKKYVKHFDGKNSFRIKEFIKDKYFEKTKSCIK